MSHHHIEGLYTFLFKFWRKFNTEFLPTISLRATGNDFMQVWTNLCYRECFVRLIVGRKMHLFLGSRSEQGGACRAPKMQVIFKTALTYNIFSVKVPENHAARYLAFEELLHFGVLRGNLS